MFVSFFQAKLTGNYLDEGTGNKFLLDLLCPADLIG